MKRMLLLVKMLVLSIVIFTTSCTVSKTTKSQEEMGLLFSYFKGNGVDGLHLAYTEDGKTFVPLNNDKSFIKSDLAEGKLMRDPCIYYGTDGTFHMVWTNEWKTKSFGYASSKDLITWTSPKSIPVMDYAPKTKNTWAPEIAYDSKSKLYYIIWSSTVEGEFPETFDKGDDGNNRCYYVTTKDFKEFSKTQLFYNPGFNCIDASVVQDGDKFVLFIKDETKSPVAKKNIRIGISDKIASDYKLAEEPITKGGDRNTWAEGPCGVKVGEFWYLYFDRYTAGKYDTYRSKDLKTWEDISGQSTFPKGARHGAVLKAPKSVIEKLKALK